MSLVFLCDIVYTFEVFFYPFFYPFFTSEVIMSSAKLGFFGKIINGYMRASLILLIFVGMLLGIFLGVIAPLHAGTFKILGDLFVGALKAIAPILVFILVCAAVTGHKQGKETKLNSLIFLYLLGTFAAALVAVVASFAFPSTLLFQEAANVTSSATVKSVIMNLVTQIVSNPIQALAEANYISLIFWAVGFGLAFQHANQSSKDFIADFAQAVSSIVKIIVRTAPFGVFSLVYTSVGAFGVEELYVNYGHLLLVLIGSMFFVGFVVNPLIVFIKLRQNPYPLIWLCIKNSGLTAFFTRSSAANIPVNMDLCRRLDLPEETYAISIPLGATINMAGAAITITVLTLAAANTIGIQIDILPAIGLSVIASICACGASGVAGGSLMLIPLACSLFNISNDIALQVVAIGFVIGILQDSTETALNSSTDVVFTATAVLSSSDNVAERVRNANAQK